MLIAPHRWKAPLATVLVSVALGIGCGARTGFLADEVAGATSDAGADVRVEAGADVAVDADTRCAEGTTRACGSSVGACKPGIETCSGGAFGSCQGAIGPKPEGCNGIDENCNGTINDCDPGAGTCTPTLTVTGSTPSSPSCIDFPVSKGSHGSLTYTCPGSGGAVTAVLDGITFHGTVTNNVVSLDAITTTPPSQSPDGCTWQEHHHIQGSIPSGHVDYSYSEMVIAQPAGAMCWSPCTETGTVAITWTGG